MDDAAANPEGTTWYAFWRDFYTRVTSERLDAMSSAYKGSTEEASDLAREYRAAKGDMDRIMGAMMFSTQEDEPRYRQLLEAAIEAGDLPKHRAFTQETAGKAKRRKERASREAAEAEEHAKELGLDGSGGSDALAAAIVARQANRQQGLDGLLSSLEARHGGGGKAGKPSAGVSKRGVGRWNAASVGTRTSTDMNGGRCGKQGPNGRGD